jgi:UrcA family protein
MTRHLIIVTSAALGLFAGGSAPAFAAAAQSPHAPYHDVVVHEHLSSPTHEVRSKHVRFTDVDISTAHGADTLVRRLKNASERVCGGPHNRKESLRERSSYKTCVKEAMDEAVQGVNAPAVSEAYKRRLG